MLSTVGPQTLRDPKPVRIAVANLDFYYGDTRR
jgi:hypothetical protein